MATAANIFVAVLMTSLACSSDAVECYSCNSAVTPGCGYTLTNPASIPTCTGIWCAIGSTTVNGSTLYVRDCSQTAMAYMPEMECADETKGGVPSYDCMCNNVNLCNEGFTGNSALHRQQHAGVYALLTMSAAVVLLAKLQG